MKWMKKKITMMCARDDKKNTIAQRRGTGDELLKRSTLKLIGTVKSYSKNSDNLQAVDARQLPPYYPDKPCKELRE